MRIVFIVFVISSIGCRTLKTAQTDNVKSFARSARILSAVPGRLYNEIADYRHNLKMIEVSTMHRSEKLVEQLNVIAGLHQRFKANAAKINSAAALIESYSQSLLALTDAAYEQDLASQSDELSLQLNTAFASYNTMFNKKLPLSVGQFIGGVVTKLGSVRLRSLQRKYLKSFVDTGALIINDVCDYYTGTLSATLKAELSSLDNQFTNVMTHFYDDIYEYQQTKTVNPFDYLRLYNPLYLELKDKLDNLHGLEEKMEIAMQKIKTAHQGLQGIVDTTPKGELLIEIRDLYLATRDVKVAVEKSSKNK